MNKILVIEDEKNIANMLRYAIEMEGYVVNIAFDGHEACSKIENFKPDLILLDIMIPKKDGYQLCREYSDKFPIIMLTAKSDIVDKIAGIELGADDYITKPFDIREVIIRIKAILRRQKKTQEKIYNIDGLTIYNDDRRVVLGTREMDLTPIEYKLLNLMVESKNKVFSRDELLDKVWGYEFAAETRSVDIHIQRLRKKLGAWSNHIRTVYGIGYQLIGETDNED